ncbi:MAG: hypothetical protein SPG66_04745 [Anaerovibrio sp.]|uniref:hypothetical protein n=1 Tax=Anaerovibrio lipolyticus TaxID=82374 RepID=UPI001F40DC15|nr:hypothetical protein [Anaerovibrio lipolyticus]MCF2602008.1 hypothetical protein [Anaerovibrio lipolyticus]MDY5330136.1 hypothetical protein [Anaerovibrio sp.]
MKKLLLVPAFMLAFFFSTISSVSAADVWVEHWDSENKDIYVVEDTISGNSTDFSVVVKEVRNGRLINQQSWYFNKFKTDFWRCQSDEMRIKAAQKGVGARMDVVMAPNRVFEYCADSLGIYYYIDGYYYY